MLKVELEVSADCWVWVTIRGLPVAYDDIGTVYGDQGSECDNVHLHCEFLRASWGHDPRASSVVSGLVEN